MKHDPNCAVVRAGDLRAYCDCGAAHGNQIPKSYLAKFLPSQGVDEGLPHELKIFMSEGLVSEPKDG